MMKVKARAIKLASMMFFALFASVAQAAGVDDGSGKLGDIQTWLDTIIPLIAGIILAAMGVAWGSGWVQGSWVWKFMGGVFIAGIGAYLIGLIW